MTVVWLLALPKEDLPHKARVPEWCQASPVLVHWVCNGCLRLCMCRLCMCVQPMEVEISKVHIVTIKQGITAKLR